MGRISIGDGIDSGDRWEGSKFQTQTPTATNAQGGIAGDFNNYQQNMTTVPKSGHSYTYGLEFMSATMTNPNSSGAWYNSPLNMSVLPLSPDYTGPGGEVDYYNPSGTDVAATYAKAHQFDVVGSVTLNATLNNAGSPYDFGALAIVSPQNLVVNFTRLLPKGNYCIGLVNTPLWSNTVTGFSGSFYWSTPQGDNLIATINAAGTWSISTPYYFTITAPWAWIKLKLNGLTYSGTSNYLASIFFDPNITQQPLSAKVVHPASVSFAISAQSNFATITYQWQLSTNGGSTWGNITNGGVYSGATTATLSISNSTGLNANQYRCNVINTNGTLASNAAVLTVT